MRRTYLATTAIIALLATSACSPGHIAANNNGIAEYAWVGCHLVTETPVKGSYAFNAIGDLKVGDYFYFQQLAKDGSVSDVVTGKPCES